MFDNEKNRIVWLVKNVVTNKRLNYCSTREEAREVKRTYINQNIYIGKHLSIIKCLHVSGNDSFIMENP